MNEETFYKIKLDLVHNTINNFVHVMQYDDGVAYIRAEIYKDWQHVYPSEEFDSAELRLKKHNGAWIKCNSVEPYIPVAKPSYEKAKTDGVYYYYQNGNYILVTSSMTEQAYDAIDPNLFYKNVGTIISLEHGYVKINVVEELTDIPGGCPAVIDLYSADGHIQTAKFVLDVDRNPIQTGEAVKNVPEDISAKLSEMAKGIANTVKVTPQTLTDEEKAQARENIGVGVSDINIEHGSGEGSAQQKQDGNSGVFDFTNKNPNATALDYTLTGNIPYGAIGNFAISLGGKGQASGKRAFQVGTTTIAKGDYSFSSGDNSVALANDSFAGNYKTVAAGVASFSIGYETQAIGPVSFVSGTRNKVDGGNAAGFGNDNVVSHNNQFVIGYFNNNKIGTLFEIGNGANDSNRSNAFEVYSDGHAEVKEQGTTDKSVAQVKFVKDTLNSYLPQIRLSSTQAIRPMSRVVHDTYTEHKITFQLTTEQAVYVEDNSKPVIKLQLSQHIPYIDGDYLYLQRNVIQTLAEREVIQFTFNNARFNFDEALTQGYVPMTEIGDGAAIYDKSTKTLFVSFVETSPKKVEDALSTSNINLENGEGAKSLKQVVATQTELVQSFRFYGAAWAIASSQIGGASPTTQQVEDVMNTPATNTYEKCLAVVAQAMFGGNTQQAQAYLDNVIMQDLSDYLPIEENKVYFPEGVAFGASNVNNSPISIVAGYGNTLGRRGYPQQSIGTILTGIKNSFSSLCSLIAAEAFQGEAAHSIIVGRKTTYKVNNFSSTADKVNARDIVAEIQRSGYISTGYTYDQIIAGNADNYEVVFNNVQDASDSLVVGTNNVLGSVANIIAGNNNAVAKAINSFIAGSQNIVGKTVAGTHDWTVANSILVGNNNRFGNVDYIAGSAILSSFSRFDTSERNVIVNSTIMGYNHRLHANVAHSAIIGYDLLWNYNKPGKTALGKFNASKEHTILEYGNGTDNNNRSNAFEVYADGHAEVQTQGTTDKSVAQVKFVQDYVAEHGGGGSQLYLHILENEDQLAPCAVITFRRDSYLKGDLRTSSWGAAIADDSLAIKVSQYLNDAYTAPFEYGNFYNSFYCRFHADAGEIVACMTDGQDVDPYYAVTSDIVYKINDDGTVTAL